MAKYTKEQKNQKFRELAEKRVNNILEKIRILSNLSNTSLYSYSEGEIKKIFDAIEEELKVAKARFRHGQKEPKKKFTFY